MYIYTYTHTCMNTCMYICTFIHIHIHSEHLDYGLNVLFIYAPIQHLLNTKQMAGNELGIGDID